MCNTYSQLDVQCSRVKCARRASQKLCKEFAQFAALVCGDVVFFFSGDDSTRRPGQRLNCFARIVAHSSIKPTDCRDRLHALHRVCKKSREHCTPQSTALQLACTEMDARRRAGSR